MKARSKGKGRALRLRRIAQRSGSDRSEFDRVDRTSLHTSTWQNEIVFTQNRQSCYSRGALTSAASAFVGGGSKPGGPYGMVDGSSSTQSCVGAVEPSGMKTPVDLSVWGQNRRGTPRARRGAKHACG
jgi:hypothetical protein